MKKLTFTFLALTSLAASRVLAGDQPCGSVLELHSCELYAGGCVVSSEQPQDGRYMLRAWNFTGGAYAGTDLKGLRLVVVQSSSQNLAAPKTASDQAVVYLPESATARQRAGLLAWAKASLPDLKSAKLQTRVVPLQFARSETGYAISAGDFIAVKTASLESCETGSCGESLWYEPRAPSTVFTVAVDRSSRVAEPLLKLTWNDGGKRSVFLAKFGDKILAKNQFVTSADLCGPADRLF